MNLDRFSGPGSTPSRRGFWDKVQEAVMASRKVEGRHVKIDEHTGAGSVINVDDSSTRRPTGGPGACCYDDGTCDDLIESECTDTGGNWQGPGTTCDDDPPPCVGVCCEESGCVDDSTPDSCATDGGTWTGFGKTCADDTPPCEGACCADGSCSITTESDCTGIYQGNGTTCEGVDCTKGACCVDGVCSQTTAEECAGTFQGLGVPCTPDPCLSCECGHLNPDDGIYYQTLTRTCASHMTEDEGGGCNFVGDITNVRTESHCNCDGSGSGSLNYICGDNSFGCTWDYTCDGTVSFGWYGLNGLHAVHEVCDEGHSLPIIECGIGAVCDESCSDMYSEPCINGGMSPPP